MVITKQVRINAVNQLFELVSQHPPFTLNNVKLSNDEVRNLERLYGFCEYNCGQYAMTFNRVATNMFPNGTTVEHFAKWCANDTDNIITWVKEQFNS